MSCRKQHLNYLEDLASPIPRSTKHFRKCKESQVDAAASTSNIDVENCTDNANDSLEDVYNQIHGLQLSGACNEEDEEVSNIDYALEDNIPLFEDLLDDDEIELEADEIMDEQLLDVKLEEENTATDPKEPLYEGCKLTYHELAIPLMTLKTAFNLTGIALSFIIKIIYLTIPQGSKTISSLKQLYLYFGSKNVNLVKHYYCSTCHVYLDTENKMKCRNCDKTSASYFIDIPIEDELTKVVERNWSHLSHRFGRKQDHDSISDVYDGKQYNKHLGHDGFLKKQTNISLLGNTDGVAIFKSSSFSVWPIYMVINELPPSIRFKRKNKILWGLWYGKEKPNYPTFFKP